MARVERKLSLRGDDSSNVSPCLAVGNGAIDLTPVELKDFAVRTFGTYDKLVLLGSMARS